MKIDWASMGIRRAMFSCCLLTLGTQAVLAEPVLSWHVVNRFPLLKTDDFLSVKDAWKGQQHRSMLSFVQSRLKAKAEGTLPPTAYLLADPGRAIPASTVLDPTETEVEISLNDVQGRCQWSVSPAVPFDPTESCTIKISVPLDTKLDFTVDSGAGRYVVPIQVKDILIVAMGDSYASGEGSPDRPTIYAPDQRTPESNDWFLRRAPGNIDLKPAVELAP